MNKDVSWGLRNTVPENATVAWGARAILDGTADYAQILPDRHGFAEDMTAEQRTEFLAEMNSGVLPKLQTIIKQYREAGKLRGDQENLLTTEINGIQFAMNTNASYGYLYISAWKV